MTLCPLQVFVGGFLMGLLKTCFYGEIFFG